MMLGPELASVLRVKPQFVNKLRTTLELKDGVDTILQNNKRRYYTPFGIKKILSERGYKFDRRVISISQLKGGVGKTAIATSLAKKASELGFKTLLIDLDKQGNSTDQLWSDSIDIQFNCFYDVLKKSASFESCIIKLTETLHIFPSNLKNQLSEIEINSSSLNIGSYFNKLIDKLDYDLIVFDTEPNLSKLNSMALACSDLVIAPVKMDKSSIDGLELLIGQIENQSEQWSEIHTEVKVLFNAFDKRMTKKAMDKISEVNELGASAFETVIRTDQEFVNAQETGALKIGSKAYEDIRNLTIEALEINQVQKQLQ